VVCVGDEGDDNVDLGDLGVEGVGIVDVELGFVSESYRWVGYSFVR